MSSVLVTGCAGFIGMHVCLKLFEQGRRVVGIDSLRVIAGMLPPRAMGLVMEWMAQHQGELQHAWDQARQMQPIDRVEPLP